MSFCLVNRSLYCDDGEYEPLKHEHQSKCGANQVMIMYLNANYIDKLNDDKNRSTVKSLIFFGIVYIYFLSKYTHRYINYLF